MSLSRNQIIIVGIIGIIILFFILVFLDVIPGLKKPGSDSSFGAIGGGKKIVLNFWGVIDGHNDKEAFQATIEAYQKINKNIQIDFQAFDNRLTYEKTLLNALATGQAPDILMFHNSWLPKHYDKALPLSEAAFPLNQFQQLFPYVAEQNFILKQDEKSFIYALPLYIDTLAFLYNKDIFDAKAIALAPTNWQSFQNLIPYLRERNPANQIVKPAAAIGGSEKNINAASDLLNLLMLQFGSQMIDKYGKIQFGQKGQEAFNFYLQFTNPNSSFYTWNENLRYSLDSFSDGSTAAIFNYSSALPLIRKKNPYLKIGLGLMPQLAEADQPVNYANYWGLSVSRQSQRQDLAWNFIIFSAANPQIAENFLQITKKPPALRSLIQKYINDSELGIFARQALTARSWPQPDNEAVRKIFSNMVESVLSGRLNSQKALAEAESEIDAIK